MGPRISILIPAYNAQSYIADTLRSAEAQTWKRKEIIVVDDGSVDETLSIAETFQSPMVKVVRQDNRGASSARNRALELAQGELIQYLDADDLLSHNKIEEQVAQLEREGFDSIIGCRWSRFYCSPEEATFQWQDLWGVTEPIGWLVRAWMNHLMMHPAAWLVPRPLAEAAGTWNESLSLNDDGEYFARVILASKEVKFCDSAKSYYRSGIPGSLSQTATDKALASAYLSLDLISKHLIASEESDRTRLACATAFQRFIYEAYPSVPELRKQAEARVAFYGGSTLEVEGGPVFKSLAGILGWKIARRLQRVSYGKGYKRIGLKRHLKRKSSRRDG